MQRRLLGLVVAAALVCSPILTFARNDFDIDFTFDSERPETVTLALDLSDDWTPRLLAGEEGDGDMHESELDRAFPELTGHGVSFQPRGGAACTSFGMRCTGGRVFSWRIVGCRRAAALRARDTGLPVRMDL